MEAAPGGRPNWLSFQEASNQMPQDGQERLGRGPGACLAARGWSWMSSEFHSSVYRQDVRKELGAPGRDLQATGKEGSRLL